MKFLRRAQPQVHGALVRANSLALPAPLPMRTQWLSGMGIAVLLLGACLLTKSLIPFAVILAGAVGWVMLSKPLYSILGFMGINVIVTVSPKTQELAGGAPSILELLAGVGLAAITAYWIFRIRFLERQPLSTSGSQLSVAIFFIWAFLVTAGGIILYGNPPDVALREILNLLPLLILPLLYERYIKTDSKEETIIFWFVLIAGLIIIFGDFWIIHNNIIKAVYLYEMGRAVLDMAATCLIILAMVSFLMTEHPWHITLGAIFFLFLGVAGLLISFTRTNYILTFFCALLVLAMGSRRERQIGVKNLALATIIGVIALVPIYFKWRLLRLFLLSYLGRFLTTEKFSSDLSLRMRFSEWKGEWHAITQSPILGHGFGATFRSFDIVHLYHVWLAFSHNSYLYIVFKTGFIGGALLLIPSAMIFYKGLRLVRSPKLSKRAKMVLRTVVASTAIILLGAFTGPTFDSKTAISWLALGWGYIFAVERANCGATRERVV